MLYTKGKPSQAIEQTNIIIESESIPYRNKFIAFKFRGMSNRALGKFEDALKDFGNAKAVAEFQKAELSLILDIEQHIATTRALNGEPEGTLCRIEGRDYKGPTPGIHFSGTSIIRANYPQRSL